MNFVLNEISEQPGEFIGLQITFCKCDCAHSQVQTQDNSDVNTKQSNLNVYSPIRETQFPPMV